MNLESLTLAQLVSISLGCGVVLRLACEAYHSVGALIYSLLRSI